MLDPFPEKSFRLYAGIDGVLLLLLNCTIEPQNDI